MTRFVIAGAGAVGSSIAAHLHLSGFDVTLVARGAHGHAIADRGLRYLHGATDQILPLRTVASLHDLTWTGDEVVLVCAKSDDTLGLAADIAATTPSATPVVSVQNGVLNEDVLERFALTAYSIVVLLPSAVVEPGVVVNYSHPAVGVLDIGLPHGGEDDVSRQIAAALTVAGFESVSRPDITAWKHRKLVLNLGNAVEVASGLAARDTEWGRRVSAEGEFVLLSAGRDLASLTEFEARAARAAEIAEVPEFPYPGSSSAQHVRRYGRVAELFALNGEISLLGRHHGIATPANDLVVQLATQIAAGRRDPISSAAALSLLAQDLAVATCATTRDHPISLK